MSSPLSRRRARRLTVALTLAAATVGVAATQAAASTLFVGPGGSNSGHCQRAHPCRTIGRAVSVAHAGDRIRVSRGVYHEMVTITKRLHLRGFGRPTIDAAGKMNGVVIAGAGASGSVVRGFRVINAQQEGILAMQTSWIAIRGNWVVHNNLGMFSSHPTGECAAVGEIPGDCGEGIHLMTVAHSKVIWNASTANAGGMLITDEFGPTHHNVIAWNHVWANQYDCGITMPSHSDRALSSSGQRQPSLGGVYANWVLHNTVNRNGLKGEGAGILLAAAGPGGAVYRNTIAWNTANGNNLAGVTMHLHAPNQDLSGNRIIGNHLSNDNLGGDPDAGVMQRTDILVFSAVVPIRNTLVKDNVLSNAWFGVWTQNGHARLSGNSFRNVRVHVHQG
jgi:hypothetical protein